MSRRGAAWLVAAAVAGLLRVAVAQDEGGDDRGAPGPGNAGANLRLFLRPHAETDTATRDLFGLGDRMRDAGITTSLNLWITAQANVTGGLDTDEDWTGTYYVDTHVDLARLARLDGASVFVRTEGGWNDGVNDAVGAVSDVNGIQDGGNEIGVTHLWFQQDLLDRRVRLRLGKLDNSIDAFDFHGRAVAFDAVPYANFAGTQFLDNALVNNAAIPFPASALAFQLFVEPVERVYVATTVAQANGNKFGIDFSDIGWTFLVESGVALDLGDAGLPGQCYVGYYHADFEDAPSGEGVYVGAAQMIHREAGTDDEGLGLFVRYGYADRVPSGIRHAWSIGGQYKGLVGGRGDDVLGIAWAQAFTRDGSFSAPYEGVLEVYYRARLAPWLHVTPHVQYIANPGSNDLDDAITLGVRGQITF